MTVSLTEFAERIIAIGLVTEADLFEVEENWESPPESVEEFANELVRQKKITKYQAKLVYNAKDQSIILGNYLILDKLGAGGMGQVYLAKHRRMGRLVAIKVLSTKIKKESTIARFQHETQAASRLSHPNIVAAFDAGEADGVHYLVMEYAKGADLKHIIQSRGPLAVAEAVDYVRQVALGLAYAHQEGIIHRDIKPSNLLLGDDHVIKVLDLGLARIDDDNSDEGRNRLTTTGSVMGTMDYMAPEQAVDAKRADARSDIYSLGCTFYYLLTGEIPYACDALIQKILAHRSGPIPDLRTKRSDVPAGIVAAFEKMVAKDPAARFQTMSEVAEALQPVRELQPVPVAAVVAMPAVAVPAAAMSPAAMSPAAVPAAAVPAAAEISTKSVLDGSSVETALPVRAKVSAASTIVKQARSETLTDIRAVPEPGGRGLNRTSTRAGIAAVVVVLVLAGAWLLVSNRGEKAGDATANKKPAKTESAQDDEGESSLSETIVVSTAAPAQEAPEAATPAMPAADSAATATPTPAVEQASTPATPPSTEQPAPAAATPSTAQPAPAATPPPNATPAAPSQPTQTLIVGTRPEDVPDLRTAFDRARPGDTILIRHRGPLDFDPVDLTGKTPLTIKGATEKGVDFWPIIRQASLRLDEKPEKRPALFRGETLDLTLEKVHLALAGMKRHDLDAVFSLGSGRVNILDCTVTVGAQRTSVEDPGPPIPLVRVADKSAGPVEVSLRQSLLRGEPLRSCVVAADAPSVTVSADHVAWAGGAGPWIDLGDMRGTLSATLDHATIYNAVGLLRWHDETVMPTRPVPAATIRCQQSLFVGANPGQHVLIDWKTGASASGLADAAATGVFVWEGDGNVCHRFAGYFREGTKPAALTAWRSLWNQTSATFHREADPMFRVWPERTVLQETTAWDLQSRFAKGGTKFRDLEKTVVTPHERLPVALPLVLTRPILLLPELMGVPRGRPNVLRVHQKDGPFKTLEAAFAVVQDDQTIEIADNGPYMPRKSFIKSTANGVLDSPVDYLCLRAAEGTYPVLVLRDDIHEGTVPPQLYDESSPYGEALSLLSVRKRRYIQLDGLHFRMQTSEATLRGFTRFLTLDGFRCSNCTFVTSPKSLFVHGIDGPLQVFWLENNVYSVSDPNDLVIYAAGTYGRHEDSDLYFSNCVFTGPALKYFSSSRPRRLWLYVARNMFFGTVGDLNNLDVTRIDCVENVVLSSAPPFRSDDAAIFRGIQPRGARNALWTGTRQLATQERNEGGNRFFPGPVIKLPPISETTGNTRDPFRKFRLKKGHPATTMAEDGGPVGVRVKYLPTPPIDSKP